MNKNEYWILDSVITRTMPLELLHPENPNLIGAFNRKHHDLSYEDLISTLMILFSEEYLYMYEPGDGVSSDILITATESNVEMAVRGIKEQYDFYYAVTAKGGALWETVSKPDWKRFTYVYGFNPTYIQGENRHIVEQFFELESYIYNNKEIVTESIEWSELRPWYAAYWKEFPLGHQIRFDIEYKGTGQPIPNWARQRLRELQQWYINPFESQAI